MGTTVDRHRAGDAALQDNRPQGAQRRAMISSRDCASVRLRNELRTARPGKSFPGRVITGGAGSARTRSFAFIFVMSWVYSGAPASGGCAGRSCGGVGSTARDPWVGLTGRSSSFWPEGYIARRVSSRLPEYLKYVGEDQPVPLLAARLRGGVDAMVSSGATGTAGAAGDRDAKIGEVSASTPMEMSEKSYKEGQLDASTNEISGTASTDGTGTISVSSASPNIKHYRHPTNNEKRNMIRAKFEAVLQPAVKPGDPYTALTAAVAIEHSMFRYYGKDESSTRYTAKARSILFNLRDPGNPDLRRRVLSALIQPERLTLMDAPEMASDDLKQSLPAIDARRGAPPRSGAPPCPVARALRGRAYAAGRDGACGGMGGQEAARVLGAGHEGDHHWAQRGPARGAPPRCAALPCRADRLSTCMHPWWPRTRSGA